MGDVGTDEDVGPSAVAGIEGLLWPDALVELYRERFVAFVRVAYLLTGRRDVA